MNKFVKMKSKSGKLLLLFLFRINFGYSLEIENQFVTQDGYIIENSIQGSEVEIPLENFFWTGSGDGPPLLLPPPKPISTLNRDVFVKTSTVLATVYIDGQSPMDEDPLCVFNCDPDRSEEQQQLQNSTIAFARSDRRFWLLTIVAGFFSSTDIPLVEDHLAKLYRSAFARQQAKHLGISRDAPISLNNITIEGIDENGPRQQQQHHQRKRRRKRNVTEFPQDEIRPTRTLLEPDEMRITASQKDELKISYSPPKRQLSLPNTVRVIIHNLTHLSEDEVQQRNVDNQVDFIDPTVQPTTNRNLTIKNQTEFLYTVFVGNKPVLAVTAAEDMKLVSTEEVVNTLGSQVFTKSEPYLKEPMATPLVPATATATAVYKDQNIIHYAMDNPILFGMLCAAIFLLIFLFVGFLLMAKTKRAHSAEIRRLTAERRSSRKDPERRPIQKLPTDELKSGNDNLAFEGDFTDGLKRQQKSRKYENPPDIHFPLPPLHRPSSSSSATSDSSVYYNKRYRDEAKNIVKEQHRGRGTDGEPMFHKRQNRHDDVEVEYNEDGDRIYAIVAKGSGHEGQKQQHKKSKAKKKKYLTENRVGSVENTKAIVEVISSPSHSSEATYAAPEVYDQMDTFNLREAQKIHERRSQQLKRALYGGVDDFEIASSVINSPNEAVNREILKALHKNSDQTSADSGSIGSFLSMASLKSFPKCAVPEPLSRVLEPVTITHYDQSDQDDRKIYKPATSGAYKRQVIDQFVTNEKRITRPAEGEGQFQRTQSDGSDPGVVGPIVWEMHKKEVGKQTSPVRDPAKTRNRFEGLLEGAIRLYETSDDREMGHKPSVSFNRNSEVNTRGKSAIVTAMRPKMGILRPVTAMPAQIEGASTPPSPSSKSAWRSAAASPLVRPLSAGPFHRPEINNSVHTTRLTPHSESVQLSTIPLIESIQNELKKFSRESSKSNSQQKDS